jgi:GntR family transcriptional regulator, transcriptional repressor for pyruvate dehydrogenase complex
MVYDFVPMQARATLVERVTEQIAFRIASGTYPPGEKMPSVRALAKELNINPSTVQVILGRLQETGFIEVNPGVGFLVRDIQLVGGIETWRYLFRFSQQLPDLATRMLADLLRTRSTLMDTAVRSIARDPEAHDLGPVRHTADPLEVLAGEDDGSYEFMVRFADAKLQAVRTTIAAAGHQVALAVINSVGQVFFEVPTVVRALHDDPTFHVALWRAFITTWDDGTLSEDGVTQLRGMADGRDALSVERFRALIDETQRL